MTNRIFLQLGFLLAVGGCGGPSYEAHPPHEFPAESESGSSGQFRVEVKPYSTADLQDDYFDADFRSVGIIPIRVAIGNESDGEARVPLDDIMLILPDGHRLGRLDAQSAGLFIGEKTGQRVNPVLLIAALPFCVLEAAVIRATPCPPGDPAADADRAAESKAARLADYESKEFKDVTLAAGNSADGFVFFRPPPGTPAFDEAAIEVRFVRLADASGEVVLTRLSGLAFSGREADPAAVTYVSRSQRGFRKCREAEVPARPWLGAWRARSGNAEIALNISDDVITGQLTTRTHVYDVDGGVDADGRVRADIAVRGGKSGAALQGVFPKVETVIMNPHPGEYWPLQSLAFKLCS